MTEEEKAKIKEETGWSDEIIECIQTMEQYEVYKEAGLHEGEVNGRKCLLKDIDMDYVDPKTGKTNCELMEKGKSPIDSKTGEKLNFIIWGKILIAHLLNWQKTVSMVMVKIQFCMTRKRKAGDKTLKRRINIKMCKNRIIGKVELRRCKVI